MNSESIRKIAEVNGFDEASRQLFEEVAELIVAVNKYYRKDNTPLLSTSDYLDLQHYILNITEEMADVTIMLEQIKYLLNISDTDIEQIINQKLNRQLERIGADD